MLENSGTLLSNKGDSYSHSSLTEEPDGETSARRAQGEDRQD